MHDHIQVTVPPRLRKKVDEFVAESEYSSRSEFLREAAKERVEREAGGQGLEFEEVE